MIRKNINAILLWAALLAALPPALQAQNVPSETSVRHTPMLEAYQAGRLEDARRLAQTYLDRSRQELLSSATDLDRDGAIRRGLDVVTSMLSYESELQPAGRFANHADLIGKSQDVMRLAQETMGRMPRAADSDRRYYSTRLAQAASRWMLSAGPKVARDQVQRVYQQFEPQLRESGVQPADVDRLLRDGARPQPRPKSQGPKPVRRAGISNADGSAILAVVRNYYDALLAADAPKLAAATGTPVTSARALLGKRGENYQRARIREVSRVTLPDLTGEQVADSLNPGPDGAWFLHVAGIRTSVVGVDGAVEERTADKMFKLQRNAGGRWTVAPE